ncbi:protein N-terminal glutamine amidohydrolase isoform X2 [Pungitius pungitius]|uniref:protein N-terminal glutamine amidohydrolase isoform X2 n=1 Tax=Pungitius pungitius TaxID=134920 RepID=UPI0018887F80|nr:protein N-terminal glutamine amidohydrolase isoform X2 [Pungitius pungitius]
MEREDRITPSREDCVYTSCYCEENVWKLCEFVRSERTAPLEELFVVFISNENRKVPLWKQRSGHGEQPVIWDYHVVMLQALRSDRTIQPAYHRMLRVIPADSFLLNFASDRSHMKKSDGSWGMPPPLYPPIHTTECQMNLEDFISMKPAVGWGEVFTLDHFLLRYTGDSSSSSSALASS